MIVTNRSKHKILFLFGPTGVGKTDLLYTRFSRGYEVINADSMQVYRGLDIGSAKPSAQMLNQIPHHLIDILEPNVQFTVGDFVERAHALIPEIHARGHMPIVSGGTAFYFKHLLFGLPTAPVSDPQVRRELELQLQQEGASVLYEQLCEVDPVSGNRIHRSDTYRILRALEVWRTSGRALSSFSMHEQIDQRIDPLIIGLRRDREELYRRIDERVSIMFEQGLVDELRRLIGGGATEQWPGMKGIGYREFFLAREAGELSSRGIAEMIRRNSRVYAKRQMTFFSSLPGVNWVHPEQTDRINSLVRNWYDG